jgi:putative transposase
MNQPSQSLAHAKWACKDHVGFVPKRRRKVLYGELRRQLGLSFHELARQKACEVLEGHLLPDHVHRLIALPPKHAVASVIGFLKGTQGVPGAMAMARLQGKERNFAGEHFWARGYAVSTVGFDEDAVRRYVHDQDDDDDRGRF